MDIASVSASTVRPLRTRILRPGWSDRLATYAEDDHPNTVHIAARSGRDIVGVGTVYPESPPDLHRGAIPDWAFEPGAAFRLRGMATDESVRGAGYGRAVLSECFDHIVAAGGTAIWCNARIVALRFYENMGLLSVGEEFDIPEIGPHYVMWRRL